MAPDRLCTIPSKRIAKPCFPSPSDQIDLALRQPGVVSEETTCDRANPKGPAITQRRGGEAGASCLMRSKACADLDEEL